MKNYICIVAGAVLLAACEQKTETVAPAASPTPTPEASEAAANAALPENTPPPASEQSPAMDTSQRGSWVSPTPTP